MFARERIDVAEALVYLFEALRVGFESIDKEAQVINRFVELNRRRVNQRGRIA